MIFEIGVLQICQKISRLHHLKTRVGKCPKFLCFFDSKCPAMRHVNLPQWPISSFLAHYCCQIGNYDSTQKLITEIIISGLKFKTKVLTL